MFKVPLVCLVRGVIITGFSFVSFTLTEQCEVQVHSVSFSRAFIYITWSSSADSICSLVMEMDMLICKLSSCYYITIFCQQSQSSWQLTTSNSLKFTGLLLSNLLFLRWRLHYNTSVFVLVKLHCVSMVITYFFHLVIEAANLETINCTIFNRTVKSWCDHCFGLPWAWPAFLMAVREK